MMASFAVTYIWWAWQLRYGCYSLPESRLPIQNTDYLKLQKCDLYSAHIATSSQFILSVKQRIVQRLKRDSFALQSRISTTNSPLPDSIPPSADPVSSDSSRIPSSLFNGAILGIGLSTVSACWHALYKGDWSALVGRVPRMRVSQNVEAVGASS